MYLSICGFGHHRESQEPPPGVLKDDCTCLGWMEEQGGQAVVPPAALSTRARPLPLLKEPFAERELSVVSLGGGLGEDLEPSLPVSFPSVAA